MRYAEERLIQKSHGTAYRIYITDCLMMISQNTANYAGGSFKDRRWADVIEVVKADTRSAEDISADIVAKAGLVVK